MRFCIIVLFISMFGCVQQKDGNQNMKMPNNSKKVFFKNINSGDTVNSPFIVEMGVRTMTIKPAGALEPGTGHHHLIIDKGFMKYGEIIPMDKQHLHYGKGDTVAEISLPPGEHKLTLQFANGMHMSYGGQFSNEINIYVK